MSTVEDIRRAITVGFTYNMYVPFVLAGEAYIAIGKVSGREQDYVCMWLDEADVPMQLRAVTLADAGHSVVIISRDDDPLAVDDGRFVACDLLVAMMTGMFHKHGHEFAGDPMVNLKVLGEVTVQFAQVAGVFNSRSAYADLMAFGEASDRAARRQPKDPESRRLRRLRRECKANDPTSWLEYATVLITASSIELLAG